MKILHTADWHLGKALKNYSLLPDQKYILIQLIALLKEHQPDVLILAGDIYDRSIPSAEAVELFDQTIEKIVLEMKIPVIAIAGNHDSAERIDYFNNLLRSQGFHIFGRLSLPVKPLILSDDFGEVYFYPIPYTEPELMNYLVQQQNPEAERIESHQQTMEWIVNEIRSNHPEGKRAVLIGHLFVNGGIESESEKKLSVGGASVVDASTFSFFNYTALGHLHAPQSFLNQKVNYSSSLLKYSSSEASQKKGSLLVELNQGGDIHLEFLPLIPQRDLHIVRGRIEDKTLILDEKGIQPSREDFLEVLLENEEVVPNAMHIVQEQFPHTMALKWPNRFAGDRSNRTRTLEKIQQMSPIEVFEEFYQACEGKPLDINQKQIIESTLQGIRSKTK